jgi:hypothetical protein
MQSGSARAGAPGDARARQELEDTLREAVEIGLQDLKAASPEEKPAVSKRLSEACSRLNDFLLYGRVPK